MIKIMNGDVTDAVENIIGHQVNCRGAMGSGVAKQIREKFPIAYESYLNTFRSKPPHDLLGYCDIAEVRIEKFVANIFGQLNYGRIVVSVSDYDSLRQGIQTLKDYAQSFGYSIALPHNIGCGLANGDWNIVYPMLEEIFADYELTLYKFA